MFLSSSKCHKEISRLSYVFLCHDNGMVISVYGMVIAMIWPYHGVVWYDWYGTMVWYCLGMVWYEWYGIMVLSWYGMVLYWYGMV